MHEALNVIHYYDYVPGEGMHSIECPQTRTRGKCSDEILYMPIPGIILHITL